MNDKKVKVNVSFSGGFFGLLTILFIALKLCGVIAWSWWWVLAPLLFPWGIILILFIIGIIVSVLM